MKILLALAVITIILGGVILYSPVLYILSQPAYVLAQEEQVYQWYHDVYVYIPDLDENGTFRGYKSIAGASVFVFDTRNGTLKPSRLWRGDDGGLWQWDLLCPC